MRPYYDHAGITIFLADCRDVIASIDAASVALVHADPPYGIKLRTAGRGTHRAKSRSYAPIIGDEGPFDPAPILGMGRPTVLWGANHYSPALPQSPSWLIWDKREDFGSDNGGDGELAWSNLGGPARIFRHLWRGTCRRSETGTAHLHPTQKPVALSTWVFQRAGLSAGDLVFVPYLGSGPDVVAAAAMGLRVIATELDESYCETTAKRLTQTSLVVGAS